MNCPEEPCAVRYALKRIGDQWSLLVLHVLYQRTHRFGEIQKLIGKISPRVLTQTLRSLEQDGLVQRDAFPTIPPRVDYSLTPLGRSLHASMQPLLDWAEEHHDEVQAHRAVYSPPGVATTPEPAAYSS